MRLRRLPSIGRTYCSPYLRNFQTPNVFAAAAICAFKPYLNRRYKERLDVLMSELCAKMNDIQLVSQQVRKVDLQMHNALPKWKRVIQSVMRRLVPRSELILEVLPQLDVKQCVAITQGAFGVNLQTDGAEGYVPKTSNRQRSISVRNDKRREGESAAMGSSLETRRTRALDLAPQSTNEPNPMQGEPHGTARGTHLRPSVSYAAQKSHSRSQRSSLKSTESSLGIELQEVVIDGACVKPETTQPQTRQQRPNAAEGGARVIKRTINVKSASSTVFPKDGQVQAAAAFQQATPRPVGPPPPFDQKEFDEAEQKIEKAAARSARGKISLGVSNATGALSSLKPHSSTMHLSRHPPQLDEEDGVKRKSLVLAPDSKEAGSSSTSCDPQQRHQLPPVLGEKDLDRAVHLDTQRLEIKAIKPTAISGAVAHGPGSTSSTAVAVLKSATTSPRQKLPLPMPPQAEEKITPPKPQGEKSSGAGAVGRLVHASDHKNRRSDYDQV